MRILVYPCITWGILMLLFFPGPFSYSKDNAITSAETTSNVTARDFTSRFGVRGTEDGLGRASMCTTLTKTSPTMDTVISKKNHGEGISQIIISAINLLRQIKLLMLRVSGTHLKKGVNGIASIILMLLLDFMGRRNFPVSGVGRSSRPFAPDSAQTNVSQRTVDLPARTMKSGRVLYAEVHSW
jgi:hypothetical protein